MITVTNKLINYENYLDKLHVQVQAYIQEEENYI